MELRKNVKKKGNNMVYLRKKNIYGNDYWYICRSKRVDGEVKQEIVNYIGPSGSISKQEAEEKKRAAERELKEKQQ